MIRMLMVAALLSPAAAVAQESTDGFDALDLELPSPSWDHEAPVGEIVRGEEERGFPSAVALGIAQGPFRLSTCSASLITPRILLTAAHCSAEFGVSLDVVEDVGVAFFGPEVDDVNDNRIIGYESIILHPKYSGFTSAGLPEFDMSVIVLSQDAPVDPVPFNLETLKKNQVEGLPVTSVGYGVTNGASQTGGGTKRSAELFIADMDDQFLISRSSDSGGSNVCSGDSGGPQYFQNDDGRWVQWSVHSWADQNCIFQSGSTRTDIVGGWIMRQIEKVHGTDNYCEAAGFLENGECDDDLCGFDPECFDDSTRAGRKEQCEADPDCESIGACNQGGGAPTWAFFAMMLAAGMRRRR